MSREYRAKVFKSGNSVALRLPKSLGVLEGTEMILREDHGQFVFEPAPVEPELIDLTGIAGSMPWLKPLTQEEREFEDNPREWHLLEPKHG
ncbi:AbrB/MazE/SpoVT family DNA-binding domain-containing protein [Sphingomonas sp. S1-29]|uniref:AbrB/MazE/SpoVT family DNA-binding domain-containing protein n=1 Tax=Sphingomonas sp. S1-29 TaxID=2991074 RepID=UPI00224062F6|nr:AbrB/MazE/SpoVT family DNA-binding domain-containing protein [Sphingomonas sp. S1-29]UZK69833.1 AbrB/MazE/SpoVT family DNA-binding domain-containing protein [Sphingomonas sp. S1-29]